MRKVTFILILLILVPLAAATFITSTAVKTAVNRHYDLAEQRPSTHDLVMESRQTVAVDTGRGSTPWLGAGLLALALVGIAAFILGADRLKELLRQWRLTFKGRPARPARLTAPAPVQDLNAHLPPYSHPSRVPHLNGAPRHEDYQ